MESTLVYLVLTVVARQVLCFIFAFVFTVLLCRKSSGKNKPRRPRREGKSVASEKSISNNAKPAKTQTKSPYIPCKQNHCRDTRRYL